MRQRTIPALLALCMVLAVASAQDDESTALPLKLVAADPNVFAWGSEDVPPVDPGPGNIAVVGEFGPTGFVVDSVQHVELLGPNGQPVPLHVEPAESKFDDAVSLVRFYFILDEGDLAAGADGYSIRWGPDVKAQNVTLDRPIRLKPDEPSRYRGFVVGDVSSTTLTAVADSMADYYFLWYLLPMAVVVVLLIIRKSRASHAELH